MTLSIFLLYTAGCMSMLGIMVYEYIHNKIKVSFTEAIFAPFSSWIGVICYITVIATACTLNSNTKDIQ